MRVTRVLLVDRNEDLLDAFAAWLGQTPDLQVVGRAHSGAAALERVDGLAPDLVVIDAALPDMSGLEATHRIKALHGAPLVIVTTFHASHAARAEALAAGADECLSKHDITETLHSTVEELLQRRRKAQGPRGRMPLRNLQSDKRGEP